MSSDASEFHDFIAPRLDKLRRLAYVLCRDWHRADDLVSDSVVKVLQSWSRIDSLDDPNAYLHRVLINTWLDERRMFRRRRDAQSDPALDMVGTDHQQSIVERITVLEQISKLPKRRRAVVLLRFYCDMSVEQTAEILGCSTGTVKSQSARALDTLRLAMGDVSGTQRGI
jgi:RNA polymerase sigma-70 factor (sigma-E family)